MLVKGAPGRRLVNLATTRCGFLGVSADRYLESDVQDDERLTGNPKGWDWGQSQCSNGGVRVPLLNQRSWHISNNELSSAGRPVWPFKLNDSRSCLTHFLRWWHRRNCRSIINKALSIITEVRFLLIETWQHICTSVNWIIVSKSNGLLLISVMLIPEPLQTIIHRTHDNTNE